MAKKKSTRNPRARGKKAPPILESSIPKSPTFVDPRDFIQTPDPDAPTKFLTIRGMSNADLVATVSVLAPSFADFERRTGVGQREQRRARKSVRGEDVDRAPKRLDRASRQRIRRALDTYIRSGSVAPVSRVAKFVSRSARRDAVDALSDMQIKNKREPGAHFIDSSIDGKRQRTSVGNLRLRLPPRKDSKGNIIRETVEITLFRVPTVTTTVVNLKSGDIVRVEHPVTRAREMLRFEAIHAKTPGDRALFNQIASEMQTRGSMPIGGGLFRFGSP